jgi:hypothetical protein
MQEFQSQAPLYSNTAQVVRRTEGIELTPSDNLERRGGHSAVGVTSVREPSARGRPKSAILTGRKPL